MHVALQRAGLARSGSDAAAPRSQGSRDKRPAAEREERQEEARSREGDGETEDDLNQAPETARRFAKRKRQSGDDYDDDGKRLGDWALNGIENVLQGSFPRHVRASRQRSAGRSGKKQNSYGDDVTSFHGILLG